MEKRIEVRVLDGGDYPLKLRLTPEQWATLAAAGGSTCGRYLPAAAKAFARRARRVLAGECNGPLHEILFLAFESGCGVEVYQTKVRINHERNVYDCSSVPE